MSKFFLTWSLMGASWQVLKKDKEILIFSVISWVCCLLVFASFAIPMNSIGYLEDASGNWSFPPPSLGDEATTNQHVIFYAILFMFYFCNYFVIVFFNSAIIACAMVRMNGGDPTLSDGFRAAFARIHLIAGWALVSASIGLILRIIENRSEKVGKFIVGLLGMVWTLVSFLVIPILVIEKKGPITALKESTILLKKTWGEQLIGNFSFGLVFLFLSIPAFLLIFLGVFVGDSMAMIICASLALTYLIVITVVQSTLQAIFQAAIYSYIRNGQAPLGFQSELLRNSMVPE